MTTPTYRPMTDEELGPGPTDYSKVRWGHAERMWEQARRANALAAAVQEFREWATGSDAPRAAYDKLDTALAAYLGDET